MTADALLDCLRATAPFEPHAVGLLRQSRPTTDWFPVVDRATLIAATTELLAYRQRCQATLHTLQHVAPIPLAVPPLDFNL